MATAGRPSATSGRDRLRWQLSRFTGYAGVVVDSTNQDVATVAADVLEMTRRGLYVVDATSTRPNAPAPSVEATALPMTMADAALTGTADGEAAERFLDRLAKLARANGSAIGIAPATPRTLAAISQFAEKGMALVPLGEIVSLRQNAQARPNPVAVALRAPLWVLIKKNLVELRRESNLTDDHKINQQSRNVFRGRCAGREPTPWSADVQFMRGSPVIVPAG